MRRLLIPRPISAGLLLSYKCSGSCRHCLYACSPRWRSDWLQSADAEIILRQLARSIQPVGQTGLGVNSGLHLSGGEPFLNYEHLLTVVALARQLGIRSTFVETNSFWCTDDQSAREKLSRLKEAGLQGMLISANPFVVEHVPFSRTVRAARIGLEVFAGNVMVYQSIFFRQLQQMGVEGTLSLEEYLERAPHALQNAELLPGGRVPYRLAELFERRPAEHFAGASCYHELVRDWHVHVDNYGHYIPGYCAGLSLGDARDLSALCEEGVDLDQRPVLGALLTGMSELFRLGRDHGYPPKPGYVSKCHLCLDVRRHLSRTGRFAELQPREFYEHLED